MTQTRESHWLVGAVRALDVPGAEQVEATPGDKVGDVWAKVVEATGVTDAELTRLLAGRYLMRVADLTAAEPYAARLLPAIVAVKYQVLPLRYTDRTLDVATADPHDEEAEREVSRLATRSVRFELAPPTAIREALARAYLGVGSGRAAAGAGAGEGAVPAAAAGGEVASAGAGSASALAASAPAGGPASDDGRTHVLVVDDDPETGTLLEAFLEGKDFRVTSVSTGPDALDLLARDPSITAVSLDYYMHPMNGLKVLKAMRQRPALDHVPVIVLTSSEDRNIEMSLFEAGADDYVLKPVDPPRYFLRLRAVLRRRRGG